METSIEVRIAKLFLEVFPIEWMRASMFSQDYKYEKIPVLIYRYKEGCDEIYQQRLSKCLETFFGKQRWVTFPSFKSRNKNYLLTLAVVFQKMKKCSEENKEYVEEIEFANDIKKICKDAIEDIPNLEKHIRMCLEENAMSK